MIGFAEFRTKVEKLAWANYSIEGAGIEAERLLDENRVSLADSPEHVVDLILSEQPVLYGLNFEGVGG